MGGTRVLDATVPQKVSYCIPLWLRDEQVKLATARIKARIQPVYDLRTDPVAIVCYGPSLNDTWEKVRDFKYIISGSGSHKFLVERGIIPTWHVEVDPRPHKVDLMGSPHPDVEYLISSTCHPKVFDHLEGFNVKLWHVFATEEEAFRTLPQGEWALFGGSNVGLRQMTIARFLGFREQHIFGMDGSAGKSGKHAAAHPNQAPYTFTTEVDGITFETTPAFLECARGTFHELDQMPDVKATFYGDGLVQAMAKTYVPKPTIVGTPLVGMVKPDLITNAFRTLNTQLHMENLAYGVGGGKHAPTVLKLVESLKTDGTPMPSVLDYGCGKGYLAKDLPFPIWEYDPAIPEKATPPRPADLVVCTDVLEHVEPETLFAVLLDLHRCVKKVGYFVIHTGPAQKHYADGRNTHLTQQGFDWWTRKLSKMFTVGKVFPRGHELHVIVGPKQLKKGKK